MNFLNNLSKNAIKAVFAFIVLISCIIGFFMGLITPEFFTGIISLVISNYFEGQKTDQVQKQLDMAQGEIQQLRTAEIQILSEKKV
jgi:predicted PurR-regulated permease PerM